MQIGGSRIFALTSCQPDFGLRGVVMNRAGRHWNDAAAAASVVTNDELRAAGASAEDEMHLLPISPRRIKLRCCQRRQRRWCVADCFANEPRHQRRFQSQLLGIGDVLPRASAAATARLQGVCGFSRTCSPAEMRTARRNAMRRRREHVFQCANQCAVAQTTNRRAHALSRNGERDRDHLTLVAGDTVATRVQVLDREFAAIGRRAAPRRTRAWRSAG